MKVLIVYYSTYGRVYRMANLIAEGVKEIPGAEPVVRTVLCHTAWSEVMPNPSSEQSNVRCIRKEP